MTKKKKYIYILMMSDEGCVFITDIDYENKTAKWEKNKKPLEIKNEAYAHELIVGLGWNGNQGYVVSSQFELDKQPYRYSEGCFEWKENRKENVK